MARWIHDAKMPGALVEYFNLAVQRVPRVELVAANIPPNFLSVDNLHELAPVQETLCRNRYASRATLPEEMAES